MRRLLILGVAVFIGGFHEWAPPAHAATHHRHVNHFAAAPQCFTAPPEENFEQTGVTDNGGTDWIVSTGRDARYWCSQRWRVVVVPLYKAPADTTWSVGFDNPLFEPSPTATYASGKDVLFDVVTEAPGAFTGYWDAGDGLRASHPITQYEWRVRVRFYNAQGVQIGTLYSPTYTP